jgi:hypothetical protein
VSYGSLTGALASARGPLGARTLLLPVVMPCHRVVGAVGDPRGFGLRLPVKRLLLGLGSSVRAGTLTA